MHHPFKTWEDGVLWVLKKCESTIRLLDEWCLSWSNRVSNRLKRLSSRLRAAESATEWRGSVADLAAAGLAHSWRGRTGCNTVRNYLSSTTAMVANDVANGRNECRWGQWRRCTLGHDSEYEIVQGLWSSCPANGVVNPIGIRWLDQKWKGWTLWKLYSNICSISERGEVEGEEDSYEDNLSCLEELQE
jgi:hypothetical protein